MIPPTAARPSRRWDTSGAFPPIGDQCRTNSCVAWATTYYGMSYEIRRQRLRARPQVAQDLRDPANQFSPLWTWNLLNWGANDDLELRQALWALHTHGAPTCRTMPVVHDPQALPPRAAHRQASRLAGRLKYREFVHGGDPRPDWDAAKRHLAEVGPLVVMVFLPWSFFDRSEEIGAGARGAADYWPTADEFTAGTTTGSWHAMICVGYDDARRAGENVGALRFRNSFGPWWRDRGSVWIPYALFDRLDAAATAMGGPITFAEVFALHDPTVVTVPAQDAVEFPREWSDFGPSRGGPTDVPGFTVPSARQIHRCAFYGQCDAERWFRASCPTIAAIERPLEDGYHVFIGDRDGAEVAGPWLHESNPQFAGFFTKVDVDSYRDPTGRGAQALGVEHRGRRPVGIGQGGRRIFQDWFWVPRTALAARDPLVLTIRVVAQRLGDRRDVAPNGFRAQYELAKRVVTVTLRTKPPTLVVVSGAERGERDEIGVRRPARGLGPDDAR